MGGLPWWLLNQEKVALRTTDPSFLKPARKFLLEVGRVLAPQQITHGGPLLMVQVENEYDSYGHDAEYMGALRQALIDGGFDVPLFACNPAWNHWQRSARRSFSSRQLRLRSHGRLRDPAEIPHPQKGRFLCLEALNSIDGKDAAAIAEIDAIDANGEIISKAGWSIFWVSSESGHAENVLDGQPATFWHSAYNEKPVGDPHH